MMLCKEASYSAFGVKAHIRLYTRDEGLCREILEAVDRAASSEKCREDLVSLAVRLLEEHGGCKYREDGFEYVIETGDGAIRVELSLSGLMASTARWYISRELRRRCSRGS